MRPRPLAAIAACSPGDRACRSWPDASLLDVPLHIRAQTVAQIRTRHAVGDVGAQEAGFRAAIVALAQELNAKEFLLPGKPDHRVRKLDLAAGAVLVLFEDRKDLGLQDVASGDGEIRRRSPLRRLFHHAVDLEHLGLGVTRTDAA